jgi:hypothetical protein
MKNPNYVKELILSTSYLLWVEGGRTYVFRNDKKIGLLYVLFMLRG